MKVKIRGGTTASTGNLCETCTLGLIAKGDNFRQRIQYCQVFERAVDFEVRECSSFIEKTRVSLHDMRQMAWVIQTDKDKKNIGFVRLRSLDPKVQSEIAEEIGTY